MAGTMNTLGDLTNHLFEELERLGDEEDKRVEFRDKIELSAMCSGDGELIGGNCVSG